MGEGGGLKSLPSRVGLVSWLLARAPPKSDSSRPAEMYCTFSPVSRSRLSNSSEETVGRECRLIVVEDVEGTSDATIESTAESASAFVENWRNEKNKSS